jgi:hypothetical protein
MKPKVWIDLAVVPEVAARLSPTVEVITTGTWNNLPGTAAVIIGVDIKANAALFTKEI